MREQIDGKGLIRRKPKDSQYEHGAFMGSEKANYCSNCGCAQENEKGLASKVTMKDFQTEIGAGRIFLDSSIIIMKLQIDASVMYVELNIVFLKFYLK